MRGRLALGAEVVRSADDAATHVMLPETIDDDAGQQMPGTVVHVRDPVGQGHARLGRFGRAQPVLIAVGMVHQYLHEAGLGDLALLLDLAADQEAYVAASAGLGGDNVDELRLPLGRGMFVHHLVGLFGTTIQPAHPGRDRIALVALPYALQWTENRK